MKHGLSELIENGQLEMKGNNKDGEKMALEWYFKNGKLETIYKEIDGILKVEKISKKEKHGVWDLIMRMVS